MTMLFFFVAILRCAPLVLSRRPHSSDPCLSTSQWDLRLVRSYQMTVLINGYSESRIPLLQSIVAAYSVSASVSSVLVLWGNPTTPIQTLNQLSQNLSHSSIGAAPISVLRQPSSSLNSRFLPRKQIGTRAVLISDDDVLVDLASVEFAFRLWASNPDRLIGFFPRSHDFDLGTKDWIYTVHPEKYSLLLTKLMILSREYLHRYSCGGGQSMKEMREVVDRMGNCEDILMNFVVADASNAGPVLVGAERARDWGDARNEGVGGEEVTEVGLSSRKGGHRRRRGECMREFHRLMGKMPLRYSYGKVINSVGEQSLCRKRGSLVLCDQQV